MFGLGGSSFHLIGTVQSCRQSTALTLKPRLGSAISHSARAAWARLAAAFALKPRLGSPISHSLTPFVVDALLADLHRDGKLEALLGLGC